MESTSMKVLVVGATGGSGRATVEALLARGHAVTAFARHADRLGAHFSQVNVVNGDAMNRSDVEQAVAGQDAVIVALGISENAIRVRLFGSAHTPMNIRSAGTRNVIAAMQRHGVRTLLVQTSFGVGATRDKLPFLYRLFFQLILKPQIADTESQERAVRASGLDWVITQPVNLNDRSDASEAFASPDGEFRTMQISRRLVGRFFADALQSVEYVGRSVALSGCLSKRSVP